MKKLIIVILLLPLFFTSARAEGLEAEAARKFGASSMEDILSDSEREISGEMSFDGSYDVGGALARLWRDFVSRLVEELRENLGLFSSLVALSLICAFASVLGGGKNGGKTAELVCCCIASSLLLGNMESIVNETVNAMYRLSDYSKAALPVIFTAAAAGGAVSSAATKFAAVSFALDVLMSISQKLIIPLVYAFLAMTLANSLFSNPVLSAVQKLCKWASTTLMTGMTLAFTTYISMVGAIGTAVDTAAVKTARTFISGTLPVVGGMISDASAMILSAAGVVRSCAGVFGLVATCVLCAGPFAVLSVKMLLLKGVSALADSMESSMMSSLFSGLGTAMALLLGLLGSCGIMLFISLTAGMKVVSV